MRLYSDINSTDVTTGLQDSSHTPALEIKSGSAVPFSVFFRTTDDAGQYVTERLTSGWYVKIYFKEFDVFDGPPLASATTTTYPATDADPYLLTVNLDNSAIRELFENEGNPGDPSNDVPFIATAMVVMYSADGSDGSWIESKDVAVTLRNKRNRYDETPPAPVPPSGAAGNASVANGAESKAITFAAEFDGPPKVIAQLHPPSGGDIISCTVDNSTITAAGFTAVFGAATPNADYQLTWFAIA